MFGYSNLPNSVELYGRSFGKDELLALICGYSGNFIEFASITGLAKVINTALTLGQEDKARFVIDEFLNAKIDCRLLEYEMYAGTRRVEKERNCARKSAPASLRIFQSSQPS